MLAVMRWTGWRVRTARSVIEITVFAIGIALNRSEVGIGTILLTFCIGPVVDFALHLFRVFPADAPSLTRPEGARPALPTQPSSATLPRKRATDGDQQERT
jgi:hypothetical protein